MISREGENHALYFWNAIKPWAVKACLSGALVKTLGTVNQYPGFGVVKYEPG